MEAAYVPSTVKDIFRKISLKILLKLNIPFCGKIRGKFVGKSRQ